MRPEGATHERALGEPVLRRDPTAFEKLAVIEAWRTRMIEAEVNRPCELSTETKRTLTSRFQFEVPTVDKWFKTELELRQFVATSRVGVHGLRAFGSRAPTTCKSKAQGRRLQHAEIGVSTVAKPLEAMYHRLEIWFNKE